MSKENVKNLIVNGNNVGIYVHIPFCNSKCLYCNFYSNVVDKCKSAKLNASYVEALCKEIKLSANQNKDVVIDTIYFGGGTPTAIGQQHLCHILKTIKSNFNVLSNAEVSVEVNPNSITQADALSLFEGGFNRASVGLQCLDNSILKLIGRTHNVDDFSNCITYLKAAGFKNISCDLMLGLPTQTVAHVKKEIKALKKYKLQHVSCYYLILEEDTPLFNLVQNGTYTLPNEEECVAMYIKAHSMLKRQGIKRYEVSNFAKPGYHCRHNFNCWQGHSYLGFGAAAHGFINGTRYQNVANTANYVTAITKPSSAMQQSATDTAEEEFDAYIMLALRTTQGINLQYINNHFGINLLQTKKDIIKKLIKAGYLKLKNNYLHATYNGFFILNQLILFLVSN